MSLARLWQQQALEQGSGNEIAGKRESVEARRPELRPSIPASRHSSARLKEAHQMLSDIYNWFTEGFDTKDLQEAKVLLKELSQ